MYIYIYIYIYIYPSDEPLIVFNEVLAPFDARK